jgi:hypothetical protein
VVDLRWYGSNFYKEILQPLGSGANAENIFRLISIALSYQLPVYEESHCVHLVKWIEKTYKSTRVVDLRCYGAQTFVRKFCGLYDYQVTAKNRWSLVSKGFCDCLPMCMRCTINYMDHVGSLPL